MAEAHPWTRRFPETNACARWLETGSKSSMGRLLIHIDARDAQDFLARVSTVLRSTIAQASTRIPNPASKLTEHLEQALDHWTSPLPVPQPLVRIILSILCIHVQ